MSDIFDNDDLDKDIEEEIDCDYNSEPVCPYCGYHKDGAWELGLGGDGDDIDVECGDCGETYRIILNLEITYSTEKL
jgi:hypothetical protein